MRLLVALGLLCSIAHADPLFVPERSAPQLPLLARPIALAPRPVAHPTDDDAKVATARLHFVGHALDDQLDTVVSGAASLAYRILGHHVSGFVQTVDRPRLVMVGITFVTSRL